MTLSKKTNFFIGLCKALAFVAIVFCFSMPYLSRKYPICRDSNFFSPLTKTPSFPLTISKPEPVSPTTPQTNLSHVVFGVVGSEGAWHNRRAYIESWWRPNVTRGFLYLDKAPTEMLLPWPETSPPYRVSEDLTGFLNRSDVIAPRIVNAIMEAFREEHENLRWLVMGDDDSIFFVDNIVDVVAQYDHTKYYYFGGQSECIISNYRFSFTMGFGGGGLILSYGLAKALADDMKNCLIRYNYMAFSDQTAMSCVADLGVQLTPLQGLHQIDLWGVIWGYLSAHPDSPLMSLHHFDVPSPLFPSMNRVNSASHLMKAASFDQSRMLQQTICYYRPTNWSFSISWGYSAQIYESILPRSYLKLPIETFMPWGPKTPGPLYMFNTRLPSEDPCEAPHVFFYETIETTENEILTNFTRAWPWDKPACFSSGNHSAASVSTVLVHSPDTKRFGMDRSECCDVIRVEGDTAEVKFRECAVAELIA